MAVGNNLQGGPLPPVQPAQPQAQPALPPTKVGTVVNHLLTGSVIPATTFGLRVFLGDGAKNLVMGLSGLNPAAPGGAVVEALAFATGHAGAGKLTGGHEHGALSVASVVLSRGINKLGRCCMDRDLIGVVAWSGKDRKFQDNMIPFAFGAAAFLRTVVSKNTPPTSMFQDISSPIGVGAMAGLTAVVVPLLANEKEIPVAPLPTLDKMQGLYLGRVRAGTRMEHDNLLPALNFLGHLALRLSIGGPMDSPRNALAYGAFNSIVHYIRVNNWTIARQVAEVPDGKLYAGRGNIEALLEKTNIGHAPQSEQHHKVQTEGVINTTSTGYLHKAEKFASDAGVLLCGIALAAGDLEGDPGKIGGLPTSASITSSGALGCLGASLVMTGVRLCASMKMSQPQLEAFDTLRRFLSTTGATIIGGPLAGIIVGVADLLTDFLPASSSCSTEPPQNDGGHATQQVEFVIKANVDRWNGGDNKVTPVLEGQGGLHNIQVVEDDGDGLADSSSQDSDSSVNDNKAGGSGMHAEAVEDINEVNPLVPNDFVTHEKT